MAQFRKWIKSGNEKYEFWFTEISEIGYVRVFVTVIDSNQEFISFRMKENENNNWEITDPGNVPAWILDLKDELSNTFKDGKSRNISIEDQF